MKCLDIFEGTKKLLFVFMSNGTQSYRDMAQEDYLQCELIKSSADFFSLFNVFIGKVR